MQKDLFEHSSEDLAKGKDLTDLQFLKLIHKDKATLKRLDAMAKKVKLRLESNEEMFLEKHKRNGTFVLGDYTYTIENKMPDCRPKWKDEFEKLAIACQLNPTVYVNAVVAKVRATLKSYRTLTLKKLS